MENGQLALICNPVTKNWGMRSPISVFLSKDGEEWTEIIKLETERGEFSYPAIIAYGNTLYLTYTWKREKIVFWEIEL
jgi:predicted neuraminidase